MSGKNQYNYSVKSAGVNARVICEDNEELYYSAYILGKISKKFADDIESSTNRDHSDLRVINAEKLPAEFFDILFTAIDRVGFGQPAEIFTEYILESEKRHIGVLAVHSFMNFVTKYAQRWAGELDYVAMFDILCDFGKHYSPDKLADFLKCPMINAEKTADVVYNVFDNYDSQVYARLPRDQLDRIFAYAEPTEKIIAKTLNFGHKLADLHPAILRETIALINKREPITGNLALSIENFKLFTASYIEYLENRLAKIECKIAQAEK